MENISDEFPYERCDQQKPKKVFIDSDGRPQNGIVMWMEMRLNVNAFVSAPHDVDVGC